MNILLYINANKALVSINHNLLPQVEVCYCRDDLAAATVLPNSLSEVIAVQVVVIVQLIQCGKDCCHQAQIQAAFHLDKSPCLHSTS